MADIKSEMKDYVRIRLSGIASETFKSRAMAVIDEAPSDGQGLSAAADRIRKMTSLFLNKKLGDELFQNLSVKISGSHMSFSGRP